MKCSKNFPKVSPEEFRQARESLHQRRSKPGYKEGYEQGYKNGYKKGKKDGWHEGHMNATNFYNS